jgi:uncharacterized membrane protein required for colicin V production
MVTLNFFFFFLVLLFGIIGAMRGWAKELLVTFSVILAIFIINVLERYVPAVYQTIAGEGTTQFWLRALIIILLVFFGYQTPNIGRLAGTRFVREKFQDSLLGFFLGAFNGYLIIGTIWLFLHQAGYPFPAYISPPVPGTPAGEAALQMLNFMPPRWLGPPVVYFAVALAFLFILIVFL